MSKRIDSTRRRVLQGVAGTAALGALPRYAFAQAAPVKIGLILPMTGPFASTGKQISAACRLYMQQNGETVAGRKVELILKDDTGLAPETTKRIAQELVVQDKVTVLAGFGLTPLAFAAAPVATEAKTPMVVMAAGTQVIPQRSPFIVRTGFTLPQNTAPILKRMGNSESAHDPLALRLFPRSHRHRRARRDDRHRGTRIRSTPEFP